jgi:hypothetical protein
VLTRYPVICVTVVFIYMKTHAFQSVHLLHIPTTEHAQPASFHVLHVNHHLNYVSLALRDFFYLTKVVFCPVQLLVITKMEQLVYNVFSIVCNVIAQYHAISVKMAIYYTKDSA